MKSLRILALAGVLVALFASLAFAGPRSMGLGGSWTFQATSDIETGSYSGTTQTLSLSGMFYSDQFVFRAGMTPILSDDPNESAIFNELLMGWVWGTDPAKPRLVTMAGGTVQDYLYTGTFGAVTGSAGVVMAVDDGTLLYPNFTLMYSPATQEFTWQGRIEVVFHVLSAFINGGGDVPPPGMATGGTRVAPASEGALFPGG